MKSENLPSRVAFIKLWQPKKATASEKGKPTPGSRLSSTQF